jgi:hypothetical protein
MQEIVRTDRCADGVVVGHDDNWHRLRQALQNLVDLRLEEQVVERRLRLVDEKNIVILRIGNFLKQPEFGAFAP